MIWEKQLINSRHISSDQTVWMIRNTTKQVKGG